MAQIFPRLSSAAALSNSESVIRAVHGLPAPGMQQLDWTLPEDNLPGSQRNCHGTSTSSVSQHGPTTRDWRIPDRPRPGRKAKGITSDEQRKEQNRTSQQKFRQNQSSKIKSLTAELENIRAEKDKLAEQLKASESTCISLSQQLRLLKQAGNPVSQEIRDSKRRRLHDHGDIGPRHHLFSNQVVRITPHVTSLPSPNSDTSNNSYADFEMDFTDYNRPMNTQLPVPDGCGFCNGTDFCVCREVLTGQGSTLISPGPTAESLHLTSAVSNAPGTCDMCQKDPEQARRCQELAAKATYTSDQPTLPGIDSFTSIAGSGAPQVSQRTSCSEFIAKVKPISKDRFKRLFGKLHAYPYADRPGQEVRSGSRPALDLDAEEAAAALTSLANGM